MAANKIAVIGGTTDVLGFIAIGFEAYPAENTEEAEKLLKTLTASEEYAVIFVNDALAKNMEAVMAKYMYSQTPAVIVIPGSDGSTGYGLEMVKQSVEKAVGADILFKDN